jgi:protein-tyrosine-phosphatase/DNA-binding transcriptional ArsR family regulator
MRLGCNPASTLCPQVVHRRPLPETHDFDISAIMEVDLALRCLAAMAQEGRLRLLRLLVRHAPDFAPAGELARELAVPASTLSTQLRQLEEAGLVEAQRRGRSILYALRAATVQELLWFLGEDCFQGRVELCPPPSFRIENELQRERDGAAPVVLFVSLHDALRGPLAATMLKALAPDSFEIHSAGIRPHERHPFVGPLLEERGFDKPGPDPRDLGEFLGKGAIDEVIALSNAAHEHCARIFPFASHYAHWQLPESSSQQLGGLSLEAARQLRDDIEERARSWLRDRHGAA